MRLLIVEDEKRLALALAKGLSAEGFAVDVVHDGSWQNMAGLWRAEIFRPSKAARKHTLILRNRAVRLNRRGFTSVAVAVLLTLIGCWRFASDVMLDARSKDPRYVEWLKTSPLRYVMRGESDGTFWGDLNTQWFKLLSIPCAMALVYLWHRRRLGSLRAGEAHFRQAWVRALWIGIFFVASEAAASVAKQPRASWPYFLNQ